MSTQRIGGEGLQGLSISANTGRAKASAVEVGGIVTGGLTWVGALLEGGSEAVFVFLIAFGSL